jgi:hypothetical protein
MRRPGWLHGKLHRHAIDGLSLRISHTHDQLGSLWESRVWETKKDNWLRDL